MTPAIFPRQLALAGLLAAIPLFGGFREDIGFSALQSEFDTLPNGSSLKIAHIEYVRDGVWAPQAVGELTGKAIEYSPSIPASFSYHGDEVGRVFYGSLSSIIPGASQIRAFEAWNYYDYSLNTAKGIAPAVADWDVENHSYISNAGMSNNEGGRRLDFRIDRDGITATVVLENGTGTIPPLFGNTYNTIVVGSSTGSHSRGGTTRDVNGRLKPDIVGTANWTSYAGPIVGSTAGLLIAKAKSDSSLGSAERPEVVKALLMAGATKDEFPSWSRSASVPIDPIYGAGEVNIRNSYSMLVAGRQAASPSTIRSSRGWDLNSVGTGSSLRYFFTIGAGQSGTVSAVLTWHRNVAPTNGAWNQGTTTSLDNLDLRLYRANSSYQTSDLLQDSVATIDNVEHIFLRDLTEGTYALEVSSVSGSKQFGLAWMVSGVDGEPQPPPPSQIAPTIVTQPVAQTVTQGSGASFSVEVTGTSPFSFQWRKDGSAISGASSSSFSIGATSLADAGTYTVSISNAAGSALSNGAFLTVNSAASAPGITSQPASVTVNEGGSASFSVSVEGTAPFSYQWRKSGVAIAGATSSSYSINPISLADTGSYTVAITNSAGTALSNAAYLTVSSAATAPSITSQPASVTASEAGSASFSVSVEGTAPFSYQWKKSGVAIAGATSSSYSINPVSLADEGSYTVAITNSAGTALSNAAYLTVSSAAVAPSITSQPAAAAAIVGGNATFSVTATGTSPFSYQWRKDGVAISGANGSSLSLSSVTLSEVGTYSVVVSNTAGSATSLGAYFTVSNSATAPAITTQPVGQNVPEGTTVSFTVSATGTNPMTYQWRKDGSAIAGATLDALTLQAVSPFDSGSYSVVITNAAGSATSNGAYLHVSQSTSAPTITSQPVSATVAVGASASFSVAATGSGTLSYQWRKGGAAIAGAASPTLSIPSAQTFDAATYTVLVSNSAGSVVSPGATLTVQSTPTSPTTARLGNISSRARVENGSGILISGFVVSGSQPKTLLVRAVGPTLANFNLGGLLNRPTIRIHSGEELIEEVQAGRRVPSVQATRDAASIAGAFSIPDNSLDSAIVRSFAPGGYTVHVSGEDGGKGIAIVEVYDLDSSSAGSRVVNLSTRSHVGRNDEILIPGVSVTGTSPKQVLIRAVGPGLRVYDVDGVLERPKITLYRGNTLVIENTGWTSAPNASEMPAVASRVGAFALSESSADSALLVTLAPGGYTLHISGADGGTGVVLAEVFEVQ